MRGLRSQKIDHLFDEWKRYKSMKFEERIAIKRHSNYKPSNIRVEFDKNQGKIVTLIFLIGVLIVMICFVKVLKRWLEPA